MKQLIYKSLMAIVATLMFSTVSLASAVLNGTISNLGDSSSSNGSDGGSSAGNANANDTNNTASAVGVVLQTKGTVNPASVASYVLLTEKTASP